MPQMTMDEIVKDIMRSALEYEQIIPDHQFVINNEHYEFRNGFYFKRFGFKQQGTSFGELALTSDDCIRNATIKCEEDCVFAILDRKQFERTIHRI